MEILCWLLLSAVFIILEIASLGLTSIWFAGGAFVAAIAGALGGGLVIQILCFVAVSVVLLIFTRPVAIRFLDANTEKTNAEALIGQHAVVLQEINNLEGVGQAKVNGMEWTARAREDTDVIPIGEKVKIVEIQGVKLIVESIKSKKEEE